MNQTNTTVPQEEWLKVLSKGMVTLPKKWREELGIVSGDIVRAKKEGNRVVIESRQGRRTPYRIYTDKEIEEFIKEDKLPRKLQQTVKADLASRNT